ncbi:hypothetical protein CPB83DRAFT_775517 [Crepidotus variabilis]|uniref:SH3 domain-containing protein n=1 Tax=Crepidotus variabilis TaxID=179855 RepID=A0A9P6JJW7_9AGAR|nr:hypothetical protein CPB83DRAFT_775517 [Crepidotus variabilis]
MLTPIASSFDIPPTPAIPPGLIATQSPPENAVDPFADANSNPFEDAAPPPDQKWKFNPLEIVRRPFVPQLQDELEVKQGDEVRIVQAFDDGWALAELRNAEGSTTQGLIPLDCLRLAGQSLPSFFASKRRSSSSTVNTTS